MPANLTETTATAKPARQVRLRPLVSPDLVRRWAAQVGVIVPDGPLDDATVALYLYWRAQRRTVGRHSDVRLARPAARVPGAAPPVSPALLRAASCASDPAPCPTCGGPGYLTYVDLSRAVQRQRCHPCGRQWTSAIAPDVPDGGAHTPSCRPKRSALRLYHRALAHFGSSVATGSPREATRGRS